MPDLENYLPFNDYLYLPLSDPPLLIVAGLSLKISLFLHKKLTQFPH